jgi:hypothetical protein
MTAVDAIHTPIYDDPIYLAALPQTAVNFQMLQRFAHNCVLAAAKKLAVHPYCLLQVAQSLPSEDFSIAMICATYKEVRKSWILDSSADNSTEKE